MTGSTQIKGIISSSRR